VNVSSVNENTTAVSGLGVKDKDIPEVDVTYFFNKNVAAELILTVPQQMTVKNTANGEIGTFNALPPTLTLQYHFTNFNSFKPYVGAGLNYTKITQTNVAGGAYSLDDNTYGFALQMGVDIPLTKQVSLNLDVKKLQIKTGVYSGATGAKAGDLTLDPTLIGVGIGYRF
jgi:outer membrane protein